jgi:hypothetical protein
MNNTTIVSSVFAVIAVVVTACGGGAEAGTSTRTKESKSTEQPTRPADGDEGAADSNDDEAEPAAAACVEKGAKANAEGVGAYCDETTKCESGLCTGDFGAPKGAQFCTKPCQTDAECGEGAVCFEETRGKGCVPQACVK